jgi:hypothetical protein
VRPQDELDGSTDSRLWTARSKKRKVGSLIVRPVKSCVKYTNCMSRYIRHGAPEAILASKFYGHMC